MKIREHLTEEAYARTVRFDTTHASKSISPLSSAQVCNRNPRRRDTGFGEGEGRAPLKPVPLAGLGRGELRLRGYDGLLRETVIGDCGPGAL